MSVLLVVPRNLKCHWSYGPTRLTRGHVAVAKAKVCRQRCIRAGCSARWRPRSATAAAAAGATLSASPVAGASEARALRPTRRGASELPGTEELLRALCACVVQAIVVIVQPRWASWGGSARARGPGREGGDLGHARGARGRPAARLACWSARSALFEPVSRSSSSEASTLRRSAQSA